MSPCHACTSKITIALLLTSFCKTAMFKKHSKSLHVAKKIFIMLSIKITTESENSIAYLFTDVNLRLTSL